MGMNRRDFLKLSAGSGLLLASDVSPSFAATPQLPPDAVGILYDATLSKNTTASKVGLFTRKTALFPMSISRPTGFTTRRLISHPKP
jgi:hypothetical protein